jgi:hypothetical protein
MPVATRSLSQASSSTAVVHATGYLGAQCARLTSVAAAAPRELACLPFARPGSSPMRPPPGTHHRCCTRGTRGHCRSSGVRSSGRCRKADAPHQARHQPGPAASRWILSRSAAGGGTYRRGRVREYEKTIERDVSHQRTAEPQRIIDFREDGHRSLISCQLEGIAGHNTSRPIPGSRSRMAPCRSRTTAGSTARTTSPEVADLLTKLASFGLIADGTTA